MVKTRKRTLGPRMKDAVAEDSANPGIFKTLLGDKVQPNGYGAISVGKAIDAELLRIGTCAEAECTSPRSSHKHIFKAKTYAAAKRKENNICRVDGCYGLPAQYEMYCGPHRYSFRMYGNPLSIYHRRRLKNRAGKEYCSVSPCRAFVFIDDLCKTHSKQKQNGTLTISAPPPVSVRKAVPKSKKRSKPKIVIPLLCSVDDCFAIGQIKWKRKDLFCQTHYSRIHKNLPLYHDPNTRVHRRFQNTDYCTNNMNCYAFPARGETECSMHIKIEGMGQSKKISFIRPPTSNGHTTEQKEGAPVESNGTGVMSSLLHSVRSILSR